MFFYPSERPSRVCWFLLIKKLFCLSWELESLHGKCRHPLSFHLLLNFQAAKLCRNCWKRFCASGLLWWNHTIKSDKTKELFIFSRYFAAQEGSWSAYCFMFTVGQTHTIVPLHWAVQVGSLLRPTGQKLDQFCCIIILGAQSEELSWRYHYSILLFCMT